MNLTFYVRILLCIQQLYKIKNLKGNGNFRSGDPILPSWPHRSVTSPLCHSDSTFDFLKIKILPNSINRPMVVVIDS